MEDMARLALVEQDIKDKEKFIKILYELLQLIGNILDNPHDNEFRSIESGLLKNALECEAFCEYLKYIGFEPTQNNYTYPKEQTLSKLRMTQAAIDRKISFCYGPVSHSKPATRPLYQNRASGLTPSNVLVTDNPLLKKIEELFNMMLIYEDEKLQEEARQHMPLVTLQLMALDRMREHQKKIKTGEIKGDDMSFDIAVLMELMSWFRYKFFTWVDKPNCEVCGGPTELTHKDTMTTEAETCSVEVYRCSRCGDAGGARFARHNDVRTLLRTRRGRCGEFANCFTLLCRSLGYDTRYVYDTTDHVWCEVFDFDSNSWMHVDPCEVKINAPLMYSHGWKKKLCYVIAVSRDDLQDVTWRYTSDHKEVLGRRLACGERELVGALLELRAHRHAQLTAPRRRYLARRALAELVHLMLERTPEDYEAQGRISGSRAWRAERGEIGTEGHTFEFDTPGMYTVQYYTSADRYVVSRDGLELARLDKWSQGVFECKRVFRKVENDWRQVYLAREEDATTGFVSWKLAAKQHIAFDLLAIKLTSAVYETGNIQWTLKFDEQKPITVKLGESLVEYKRSFRTLVISAALSGGVGGAGWQHAQLFRQPLAADACAMHLHVRALAD